MARLACFPVLLFVFLGVHAALLAPASHGARLPSTYNTSMCLESIKCGSVVIRYPFYLSNATESTSDGGGSFSCGYTDLKISCQEKETPIIQLGPEYYTVRDITYSSSTGIIRLVDGNVFSGGSCPAVSHNVSFEEVWLKYTSSSYSWNLTFFYGCPPAPEAGPLRSIYEEYQISCTGFRNPFGGGPISLVSPTGMLDTAREQDLAAYCQKIITVPVSGEIPNATDNPFTSGGYGVAIKRGFNLAWSQSRRPTDGCARCEGPGSAGRCAYGQDRRFLGCLCSDGTVGCWCSSGTVATEDCKSGKSKKGMIIGVSVAGATVFLIAAVAVFWIVRKKKKQRKGVNSSSKLLKYSGSGGTPVSRCGDMESGSIEDVQAHQFSYEELEEATDCFSEKRELGDGGFGTVYKGYLKDGRVVAVKRLYNNSFRRVEQFVNEAAILSRLRHPNLVMFYGCTSSQSRELLLVYEFVANGTVADHLHGHRAAERALPWPLRLNIAVESAAALTYLHAIEPPIVHRDVKTTNILLDADFHVKVADFGLSRLFPLDATHVSTAPQGTPGYVDPEYHQCYQLTDKSDVYSFGVVLVELISSKPAVDITRHRNEINLAGMAISKIQKCELEQLVDLELGYDSDPATRRMMTMVAELAFRCLQQNGEMRPPIKEVLEVLRGIQDECRVEKDGGKDKGHAGPFSPNSVHVPWESRETTPNTSRD